MDLRSEHGGRDVWERPTRSPRSPVDYQLRGPIYALPCLDLFLGDDSMDSTETVVVILRRSLSGGVPLLRRLETVADRLAEKLCIQNRLACLYEFDSQILHQVVH